MLVRGIVLATVVLWPGVGRAATFTVTSTADLVDSAPGDGVCASFVFVGPGFIQVCTLRGAIQEANATPAADTILVPAGVFNLTRTGANEDASATGDLDLTSSITIVGSRIGDLLGCSAGTTNTCIRVNGSGDRVLQVIAQDRNITVNLQSVRIEGGVNTFGAGIYSLAGGFTPTVNLVNVVVQNNNAGLFWGGGIYNAGGNLSIHSTGITSDTISFIAYNVADYGAGIAANGGTVNITGLTQIAYNTANSAIYGGAGLMAWGSSVALINGSLVYGNAAVQGNGGGLNVFGPAVVTLQNVSVYDLGNGSRNLASRGGGVYVQNEGTLNVADSLINGNQAAVAGGGIYVGFGTVTVDGSTIGGNVAGSDGGGVFKDTNGTMSLTRSTVSGNSAASDGGGVFTAGGGMTLLNSTISGNSAASGGGGLFNDHAELSLTHVTVSGNSAGVLGAGIHSNGLTMLASSIVASQLSSTDCSGIGIVSVGRNLDSDATCGLAAAGDISGGNADLLPLGLNGGGTATHALGTGSAARDVIPLGTNGCGTTITSDQRNAGRPRGTHCDIGAVEAAPVPVANAGPDQAVSELTAVTLDGSASSGENLTFLWQQLPGGPAVTLSDTTIAAPSFTAPELAGGIGGGVTLTFRLTVSSAGLSSTDVVAVEVQQVNHTPAADAGTDQTQDEGSLVTLDGTASSDPDGDPLVSFGWTQIAGQPVTLSGAATATPSFTAPAVGSAGETLIFRLTVSDGALPSVPDGAVSDVTITIRNLNDPPSCAAAQATPSMLWPANGHFVPVAITGVTDPNGDPVAIAITGVTQDEPVDTSNGPDAVIGTDTVQIRAERLHAGNGRVYRVSFTAADGQRGSCSGAVTVGVPIKKKGSAVDDGQQYDSTRR